MCVRDDDHTDGDCGDDCWIYDAGVENGDIMTISDGC